MTIEINKATVFPVAWIKDIYVNPSNNGNLQSAYYKDISDAAKRSMPELSNTSFINRPMFANYSMQIYVQFSKQTNLYDENLPSLTPAGRQVSKNQNL